MAGTPSSAKRNFVDHLLYFIGDLWLVLMILIVGALLLFWLEPRIQAFGILGIALHYLFITAPIWLALLLGWLFWSLWLDYIRLLTISELNPVLLEVSLSKDLTKTPLAMEIIFSAL